MYVVVDDSGVDRLSPRAAQALEAADLEKLQEAARALSDGIPHTSNVEISGFDCQLVPLGTARNGEPSEMSGEFLARLTPKSNGQAVVEKLTPMQSVVAEYAVAGSTVDEIADAMDRSPHTVKTHLRNIYDRLGINSRVELATRLQGAAENGSPDM